MIWANVGNTWMGKKAKAENTNRASAGNTNGKLKKQQGHTTASQTMPMRKHSNAPTGAIAEKTILGKRWKNNPGQTLKKQIKAIAEKTKDVQATADKTMLGRS